MLPQTGHRIETVVGQQLADMGKTWSRMKSSTKARARPEAV
jgi:hypothetical protein